MVAVPHARHDTLDFFFFNDTATTEIYTLSLHDALPICQSRVRGQSCHRALATGYTFSLYNYPRGDQNQQYRSEEHTSELQSRPHLVCRLLLEKKNRCR